MPVYKLEKGGIHERFLNLRSKVQVMGGGYGNGKTTAAVIKALTLARDYPGSNGIIARATFPKLNDTIRKVFVEWCPPDWIASKNFSTDNVLTLKNGSVINFRYVQQGGKNAEGSTSNLLSATYDWIVVDQIEDPEIVHKDFLDLMGRLRGNTPYAGDDPTMPTSGPRWIILMCNPTRNWVYRELVKPFHDYKKGIRNPKLIIDEDTQEPIIEVVEGSTYENAHNLASDYIKGLESTYKGQMRDRYLDGEWGAYEGLVYPQYDMSMHLINHDEMLKYFNELRGMGAGHNILEAYDHGIAVEAAYGFAFTDHFGNVFLLDGVYEREQTIESLATKIKEVRAKYLTKSELLDLDEQYMLADPAVFRRTSGNSRTVGTTVAQLFKDHDIKMKRANNDIMAGIAKVQSYLFVDPKHQHPIYYHKLGSPRFFVSTECMWFDEEITDYYWKRNSQSGEQEDAPSDRKDHAMDMTKYLFTNRPRIATFKMAASARRAVPRSKLMWREEATTQVSSRAHRYG